MEYLFSDKTGTLTQNVMEFRECSIAGTKFRDRNGTLGRGDSVLFVILNHRVGFQSDIQNKPGKIPKRTLKPKTIENVQIQNH